MTEAQELYCHECYPRARGRMAQEHRARFCAKAIRGRGGASMPRKPKKNAAAVELGRKGGSVRVPKGFAKSGKASEAGKRSAEKRWGKKND